MEQQRSLLLQQSKDISVNMLEGIEQEALSRLRVIYPDAVISVAKEILFLPHNSRTEDRFVVTVSNPLKTESSHESLIAAFNKFFEG